MVKIKSKYGELKQITKRAFDQLSDQVLYGIVSKEDGEKKLIELLNNFGVKVKYQEKEFIITTNKNPTVFEKYLVDNLGYRKCSICGKFKFTPIRTLGNDCHYYWSTYGEKFSYESKPICKTCFSPILKQWIEQLKDVRGRWVKREQPDWKKTETCYVDKEGKKYPLDKWTPEWINKWK